jgi:DNA-binding XRE family transcriptional regulator
MSDLTKYVRDRAVRDSEFADDLEAGYADFKVGGQLRQAREKSGLTQEEVAVRLETKKSPISRIESSAGVMRPEAYDHRIKALAERSSYVENVLRHALVAGLSSVVWSRDPFASLQVFNSEVDDSGFDLVLGLGLQVRYVQLKQAHANKIPPHCSVRLSFSSLAGSCVVLMSHTIEDLRLFNFRFFGGRPSDPIGAIESMPLTKVPGRRNASGERKIRANYRNVPVNQFQGPLSIEQLVDVLFPNCATE